MPASIRRDGFGLIEFLVALLLVGLLATALLKRMSAHRAPGSAPFEESLRSDLEGTSGARLTSLTPDRLAGENGRGPFEYLLRGSPPDQRLLRSSPGQEAELAERIVSLRFAAYDREGRFLPDEPAPADLPRVRKLRVDLALHAPAEEPAQLVCDRIHGLDLDGDPGNGCAKISNRTFGVILP
jgi:prepilin-type N-terminal cleavage/methylation domain-containing protein